MSKLQLARDLAARFPKTPIKALGRKLYNENKESFRDSEDARNCINKAVGKAGGGNLKEAAIKNGLFRPDENKNPMGLPEAEPEDFTPYQITGKKHSRLLVINDVHIPYHSVEACTAAISWGKKEKVDGVVINGDMLDFYQLSRFDKNPKARNFAYELEQGRQFLQVLQKQLKDVPMYYKLGNHEERYEKFLQTKAPELLDIEEFHLKNLLHAKKYNTVVIDEKRIIRLNHLNVVHGHEFTAGFIAPVNIARGLFLRTNAAAIQGHHHRSSDHTETTLDRKTIPTWSIGCLCGLTPKYMPVNKWNHGAAIVDLCSNGKEYEVRNKKIIEGKIY
jgi:predicted phosphodiesterase